MKRPQTTTLSILTIGLWFSTSDASAQCTFVFKNYLGSNRLDAPIFDADGNRLAGTNYVAMLYAGLATNSLMPVTELYPFNASVAPVPFTYTVNGQSGYFSHRGTASDYVFVGTVPLGVPAWLQVRAWDVRLGETYEDVRAKGFGGYGASGFFQEFGDSVISPSFTLGYLYGLESFSLLPVVPEPSVAWLVALGLPWLIYKRCRR